MESLLDPTLWVSFISLSLLEVILGVDNVIFIAIVVAHLEKKVADKARLIGLILAMVFRIVLLFGIFWIIGMKEPFANLFGIDISGKGLMLLAGGLFLIYKATDGLHEEVTQERKVSYKDYKSGFTITVLQIVIIDIVFSFDSVITAVGLTNHIYVIIAAMLVAMLVMLWVSGLIADFIKKYPTIKVLALSFIMMIGVFLVAEAFNFHIPRGYIYFSMAFTLVVEIINIKVRAKRKI